MINRMCSVCRVPMKPGRQGETDDGPVQLWDCPNCGTSHQHPLTAAPDHDAGSEPVETPPPD